MVLLDICIYNYSVIVHACIGPTSIHLVTKKRGILVVNYSQSLVNHIYDEFHV